jgi:hypothetical protein
MNRRSGMSLRWCWEVAQEAAADYASDDPIDSADEEMRYWSA